MKEYILRQWKSKSLTVFLMILGFLVGNIVLSVGTSITIETIKQAYDNNSGNPNNQLEIQINMKENSSMENFIFIADELVRYGEIQIVSMENIKIDDNGKSCQIIPINFLKSEDWHIPIIRGNYFTEGHMTDDEKQIVIGKDIAEEIKAGVDDYIEVNNMRCRIIGICGRDNRETQWDDVIYIPIKDFYNENKEYFSLNNYFILLKSGKDKLIENFDKITDICKQRNIEINYMNLEERENESFSNSIVMTAIASALVFTIAIINITNLMVYWMLDRKKDIAVFKALGADNDYIIRNLVKEIICMGMIGAAAAIFIQELVIKFADEFLIRNGVYCQITYINIIVAIAVTIICGMLAAIIPARQVTRIQPAEGMR